MGFKSVKTRSMWSVLMYPITTCPLYSMEQPPGPIKTRLVKKILISGPKMDLKWTLEILKWGLKVLKQGPSGQS